MGTENEVQRYKINQSRESFLLRLVRFSTLSKKKTNTFAVKLNGERNAKGFIAGTENEIRILWTRDIRSIKNTFSLLIKVHYSTLNTMHNLFYEEHDLKS